MGDRDAHLKCIACDTPTLLLRLTGECGTDDESIPCTFAPNSTEDADRG